MKKYYTITNTSMQDNSTLSIPKGAVLTCHPVERHQWGEKLRENKHLFLITVADKDICKNVAEFSQAGIIKLTPNNPEYPDTELHFSAITALYIVETVSWDVRKVA